MTRSIDRRPTDPLGQAHLALTVIRNPPHGEVVLDDGTAVLSQLQSWYPGIIRRFGSPVLAVAARRATGQLPPDACGRCLATALARVRRLVPPGLDEGTELGRWPRLGSCAGRWGRSGAGS